MSRSEQWQVTLEAAELYERYPARYILGPWVRLLVGAAGLAAGDRVLDVACGTGIVTRIAAQRVDPGGRVVGIDLNPGMIAVAQSLPAPVGASIEWIERSALDLQFPDASFDVVLCQQGLQFFPDRLVALREMRRVLHQGGRMALSVWTGIGPYHGAVGEVLARLVGDAASIKFCSSRQVPTKEELQLLATQAGFSDVEVRVSRLDIHLPAPDEFILNHLSGTPVAPKIAAANPEVRQKIATSVKEQLRRYTDADGVTYPEETHVLTGRAQ